MPRRCSQCPPVKVGATCSHAGMTEAPGRSCPWSHHGNLTFDRLSREATGGHETISSCAHNTCVCFMQCLRFEFVVDSTKTRKGGKGETEKKKKGKMCLRNASRLWSIRAARFFLPHLFLCIQDLFCFPFPLFSFLLPCYFPIVPFSFSPFPFPLCSFSLFPFSFFPKKNIEKGKGCKRKNEKREKREKDNKGKKGQREHTYASCGAFASPGVADPPGEATWYHSVPPLCSGAG